MANAVNSANAGARPVALETQIKRFERQYRKRLRKLTRRSSRLGDLLFTFPAAAFALVSGRADPDRRGTAVRLVLDGAPLDEVGKTLALPKWTRRLAPEAFALPLGVLPDNDRVNRQIPNLVPTQVDQLPAWLSTIGTAADVGDTNLAMWFARQKVYHDQPIWGVPVEPLAVFAWYSAHRDTHGGRMVPVIWQPKMRFATAVAALGAWFDRVVADLTRADQKRGPGRYSGKQKGGGYRFAQLRTAAELDEEGRAMNHCVGDYVHLVRSGECLIYSVRRGNQRMATLELRWSKGRHRAPVINQLQGYANQPVDRDLRRAVDAWLVGHGGVMPATPSFIDNVSLDTTRWKAFWQPYVNACGTKLVTPDRPDHQLLRRLAHGQERLTFMVGAAR